MSEEYDFNDKTHGDVVSDTFCVLPWIHLNTWPNGNVYPCCLTDWREDIGNLKDATLEQLWNSGKMKELRKYMLEGKKHDNCRKCFQQEENGLDSTRTSSNRHFKKHIPSITNNTLKNGHNNDFKLIYWDFRFSNLCNMKCRMCGSFLSSKWYEDDLKIFGGSELDRALINVNDYSKKDIQLYLEEFMDDVEEIYFAGGEPLLMDEHYYILEELNRKERYDVRLRYNTNLGYLKYKKWDNVKLWEKFKANVAIFASIDGFGKTAEYSRKGTKWPIVEGNLKRLIDLEFNTHISATTSIFTVWEVPDLVDKMLEMGLSIYNIQLNNVLTNPWYYNINILPDDLKDKIKEKYTKHLNSFEDEEIKEALKPKYESIFRFMDEEPQMDVVLLRKGFRLMTDKIDKGRKEDFATTFPYLADWYNSITGWEGISLGDVK